MIVKTISKPKKTLNAASIIGMSVFSLLWILIFGMMALGFDESRIVAQLMLVSALLGATTVLTTVAAMLVNSELEIHKNESYELLVNSRKELEAIKSPSEIEFARNYLVNIQSKKADEINRTQTFQIIQNRHTNLEVRINKEETRYWEQSPKDLFNDLMGWLWAAS